MYRHVRPGVLQVVPIRGSRPGRTERSLRIAPLSPLDDRRLVRIDPEQRRSRVALPVSTFVENYYAYEGAYPTCRGFSELLFVAADGATTRQLFEDTRTSTIPGVLCPWAAPLKVIPNGAGGLFVQGTAGYWAIDSTGTPRGGGTLFGGSDYGSMREMVVVNDDRTAILVRNTYSTEWYDEIFLVTADGYPVPDSSQGFDPDHTVTSLFAVDGGLVISLADGTVLGPDAGFDAMHLSRVQPAGDGRYLGDPPDALVSMVGPAKLPNFSVWPGALGWGGTNAALPQCEDPDLISLIAEYRDPLRLRPTCTDFESNGADGNYYNWSQLSGHSQTHVVPGGRAPDNPHAWAIVTESLRSGLDATNVLYLGDLLRLTAAYRTPVSNAIISRNSCRTRPDFLACVARSVNSKHQIGLAADLTPPGWTGGTIPRPIWDEIEAAARSTGPVGAVKIEPYSQASDHVHVTFPP